jgi:hypothetical protein
MNGAARPAYVNVFFAFPMLGRYLLGRRAPPVFEVRAYSRPWPNTTIS